MSRRSVYCIVPSRAQADRIVHSLEGAEFASTDISALFLAQNSGDKRAAARGASAAKKAVPTPSAGAVRSILTLIAGVGSRVIPGVAPLIAAGPIAAAIGETTVGGVAGGLTDFGVPQSEARRYEDRIKVGQILLSIHTENPDKSDQARAIFSSAGAEDICTLMVVTTPKLTSRFGTRMPRFTSV